MRYLRKFNETLSEDYEDYVYTIVGVDPMISQSGEKWYYAVYGKIIEDDAFKSTRFKDIKVIILHDEYESTYLLLVDKKYYEDNYQYKVQNLNWEEHDVSKSLKSTMSTFDFGFSNAKMVKNLPRSCSLISGIRFDNGYGGLEFWPNLDVEEPIYVDNNVELQYLIYKYICDQI